MILELDTELLSKIEKLTIGQLVFLNLVLDDNQNSIKDVSALISLVNETEIQDLIEQDYILKETKVGSITYSPTDRLENLIKKEHTMFDEFYIAFPQVIIRPDGTKGFLRANITNCRKRYKTIVGKSRTTHEHIMNCLKFQQEQYAMTGRMGYMKTMWKWLTQCEWEAIDEQMKDNVGSQITNSYGTALI